jgi:hypothetical protein
MEDRIGIQIIVILEIIIIIIQYHNGRQVYLSIDFYQRCRIYRCAGTRGWGNFQSQNSTNRERIA